MEKANEKQTKTQIHSRIDFLIIILSKIKNHTNIESKYKVMHRIVFKYALQMSEQYKNSTLNSVFFKINSSVSTHSSILRIEYELNRYAIGRYEIQMEKTMHFYMKQIKHSNAYANAFTRGFRFEIADREIS